MHFMSNPNATIRADKPCKLYGYKQAYRLPCSQIGSHSKQETDQRHRSEACRAAVKVVMQLSCMSCFFNTYRTSRSTTAACTHNSHSQVAGHPGRPLDCYVGCSPPSMFTASTFMQTYRVRPEHIAPPPHIPLHHLPLYPWQQQPM